MVMPSHIDKSYFPCYHTVTLCTAYKSTVQTEQTVTQVMESGRVSDSGLFIHGTVATLLIRGCFFITF